jgi:hypothetical protein
MKKLKAGSLQLVTFIVVVIALLLASFIVLIHIHKQFRIKTNHIIETVSLVDKGIQNALHQKNSNKDTTTLVLDNADYKSIKIHKDFWGTYEKMYSKATIKHITLKKTALVGSKRNNNEPVLYLKDNNRPLVVVGKTKIKGKAYLPKRGVKSGNIAGESYYGENYIYGTTALSENFPKLNKELLDYFKILNNRDFYNFDKIETINLNASKEHINSFGNSVQLIYSNSELVLSDVSILGHIIVQSKTKISIDKSAYLKDIILIAPSIEIRDQVKGVFQAFATKRISVAQDVNLDYPSALVLNRDYSTDTTDVPNMIDVADHSTIKGNIIALGLSASTNYEAQIKISSNATVKGIIYCEQNLELRGTVYGTVYTNNFIIKEKGSIYQNHIYNALISSEDLETEFVGVLINDSKKGIAKWFY